MISKRTKISLVLFFLIGFSCTALWLAASRSAQSGAAPVSQQNAQMADPFFDLNRRAKAAKHADEFEVRDLTDEAFKTFAPPEVPVFTQEAMKERVARAEVNYRKGASKGISEIKVAKTINELAAKLQIPEYAKVSPSMVRLVRVGLMMELPDFIAQDAPTARRHIKIIRSSINPLMSPLEATAITMFLLQQKIVNDAFQLTHKEFFANLNQKQMQKWREWRAKRDGAQQIGDGQAEHPSNPKMRVVSNSKSNDARRAAKKAVEVMAPDALLNLADSSLDTLGIDR